VADASPQDQLTQLLSGYWHTKTISVAAKLGLADLLLDQPRTAEELATATRTHPQALYRLLRALASLGIFAEDDSRRFRLTPLAECLRSNVAGSVRSLAIMRGEWQYEAWGELLYSIQTNQSAFEHLYGMPYFDYLGQNPDKGKLFDDAMSGMHGRETAAMLKAYDFSGITTLADIGGGNGHVLTATLSAYPNLRGLLFDLPAVAERTKDRIKAAGLEGRCQVLQGNFFESVPGGADAYLLRHIIHDWDDARSTAILRNCRKAMEQTGKLLVVEGVIPPGNGPALSKFFDLAMLVVPGGLERTEDEYRRLFEASGFRLRRIVPTATWISVIEGEPAG
jgi:hypothetical protein